MRQMALELTQMILGLEYLSHNQSSNTITKQNKFNDNHEFLSRYMST